jgi:hypothetical protein
VLRAAVIGGRAGPRLAGAIGGILGLQRRPRSGPRGGDFGNLFVTPVTWDFGFFRQKGPWRFGAGVTFESFNMKDPYHDELEWGFQQVHLSGTRMLRTKGTVRPYIQLRGGLDANHYIRAAGVRLVIPLKGPLGIGGDVYEFLRDSDFMFTDAVTGQERVEHVKQRNPQGRIYLSMTPR